MTDAASAPTKPPATHTSTTGCKARSAAARHRLEVQVELAHDRVPEPLAAAAVEPHVVGGPALAEDLALGGQLTDQCDQARVVGVAARLEAEHRGGVGGDPVPVHEELARGRVEVEEPARVRRSAGLARMGA